MVAARHLSQLGFKSIRVLAVKSIKDDIKYRENALEAFGISTVLFTEE